MTGIAPVEILILAVRLAFVLLLYAFVVAVLFALRSDLTRSDGVAAAAGARLTRLAAAPTNGVATQVVPLAGSAVVGRRAACDVVLRDDAVSGRHARFVNKSGAWHVEDLGSTNGTYVNGRRVSQPVPLQPGDVVAIGTAEWRFDQE